MRVSFPNGEKKDLKAVWIDQKSLHVYFVDQRILPSEIKILESNSVQKTAKFIQTMVIRGAPSIGIAGAYGIVQSAKEAYEKHLDTNIIKFHDQLAKDAKLLLETRPTAIDLQNNIEKMLDLLKNIQGRQIPSIKKYLDLALSLNSKLLEECNNIAINGLTLIKDGYNILTHCHTGAFATVDIGTALAPLKLAYQKKIRIHVYVDETRPRLQGGKLTTWELDEEGVPYTLITDSTAASLMAKGKISMVITGADRITMNGDVANKIGTYNLAVLCKWHNIPFYIAAPWGTFHRSLITGDQIPIEERDKREITHIKINQDHYEPIMFPTKKVYNPAFDITPNNLITGIITPKEIIYPPYSSNIKKILPKDINND
ncbi:MAG: S-methyl-5-thioribose-1-phosphate isomerase [Candidatus Thorarchaeota archaeon]